VWLILEEAEIKIVSYVRRALQWISPDINGEMFHEGFCVYRMVFCFPLLFTVILTADTLSGSTSPDGST